MVTHRFTPPRHAVPWNLSRELYDQTWARYSRAFPVAHRADCEFPPPPICPAAAQTYKLTSGTTVRPHTFELTA